jgi:hypothetical protein
MAALIVDSRLMEKNLHSFVRRATRQTTPSLSMCPTSTYVFNYIITSIAPYTINLYLCVNASGTN